MIPDVKKPQVNATADAVQTWQVPAGADVPGFRRNNRALNAAEEARMLLIQKRINNMAGYSTIQFARVA